ncbi:Uncharacterised protein [Mycobacteroides abscessus subsp. abscessus]|nr:hypothetical protein HMPREF2672_04310 [Staphylococcus sp. HMSC068D07]SIJ56622.1 Uncharacterised protein [Mycobacteroides abscessus subsp. abscessus]
MDVPKCFTLLMLSDIKFLKLFNITKFLMTLTFSLALSLTISVADLPLKNFYSDKSNMPVTTTKSNPAPIGLAIFAPIEVENYVDTFENLLINICNILII